MAMIVKVGHVIVVHMEVCVTKENCAVQNFNFVLTEFFMKDALNVNKARDNRPLQLYRACYVYH